jgi:hypothetical protein
MVATTITSACFCGSSTDNGFLREKGEFSIAAVISGSRKREVMRIAQ